MSEQVSQNIWAIIGLSSLIASVVTVILGLARDVLVERYRFKRQSEAGYLQAQLQVLSRMYYTLARTRYGALGRYMFKDTTETFKEINELIELNVNFIPSEIRNGWMRTMAIIEKGIAAQKQNDKTKVAEQQKMIGEQFENILVLLEQVVNKDLIPKYRKFVGNTIALLSRDYS
jgi:hypothetical protein